MQNDNLSSVLTAVGPPPSFSHCKQFNTKVAGYGHVVRGFCSESDCLAPFWFGCHVLRWCPVVARHVAVFSLTFER